MAFRIHDSVVRGEIDNRERGRVCGRIWLHGRTEPLTLDLAGNAHSDLAGCLLTFENPQPTTAHPQLESLIPMQKGTIGDLTASRRVRVFDIPLAETMEMIRRKEKPPEHMANSLYLEWFSDFNGRVVIESADYRLQISPPAWRLTADEEHQRAADAAAGFTGFMAKLNEAVESTRFKPPEDRPMTEFEWERAFRESDALTDKASELYEKYGDRDDFDDILAREMGWDISADPTDDRSMDVEEINRACDEAVAEPPQPNPLTEGVDWIREKDGSISHPLEVRIRRSSSGLTQWCRERNLLDESEESDLREMIFKLQGCGAKCAGALGSVAEDDDTSDPGFIVAGLKRALALLHESLAAADRVAAGALLPADKLAAIRQELHEVRQSILDLMNRFREKGC